MRKINVCQQFKLKRERLFIGNVVRTADTPVISLSSPLLYFKRNRKTQEWFATGTININTRIQRRCYVEHLLAQKLLPPKRLQVQSRSGKNRLFTATTSNNRGTRNHRRKKKSLLRSSNKISTTKDRLRLSFRPSSSETKSRQNENNFDFDKITISTLDELGQRLNSGLDVARAAVREGYTALRNPTIATSSEGNVVSKHGGPLLAARSASIGISTGPKTIHQKGLVMDANWWFWNLLLAASPSVLVALYCEFIVKPEMKIRYEEKEKETALEREGNTSIVDGIGDDKRNEDVDKISRIRKRQEQHKGHQQQQPDGNLSFWHQLSHSSDLNEDLVSYLRPLASWFIEQQSSPSPSSEHGHSREKGTDELGKSSTKMGTDSSRHNRLEMQKEELVELQSQIQILKDKIHLQQKQCAVTNAGSGYDSNDVVSGKSGTSDSLLSRVGNITKSSTQVGISMGREHWFSLLYWWRSRVNHRQSSDESNCDGSDDGDGDSAKC